MTIHSLLHLLLYHLLEDLTQGAMEGMPVVFLGLPGVEEEDGEELQKHQEARLLIIIVSEHPVDKVDELPELHQLAIAEMLSEMSVQTEGRSDVLEMYLPATHAFGQLAEFLSLLVLMLGCLKHVVSYLAETLLCRIWRRLLKNGQLVAISERKKKFFIL